MKKNIFIITISFFSIFFVLLGINFSIAYFSSIEKTNNIPKKIRNLEFYDVSHNQITTEWKKKKNLKYYIRLEDADRNLVKKFRTQRRKITFTGLQPNSKYYLKIRAKNLKNNQRGKWSIAKNFSTLEEPPAETKVIFGGDVMLSRYVDRATAATGDMAAPFRNVADEFEQNDLAFINLEAPFAASPPYGAPDNGMVFRVNPSMIDGLKLADINIASLSNNHIANAGQSGIDYTKEHLTNNGIGYCLESPDILSRNDIDFAFLCYSYDRNLDTNKLINDIQSVKDQGAEVIIVSMHNGAEYTENISASQSGFAHTAIDHGADLVIGHHPHVVQRMEEYNGRYIFYSLGNLVFDQNWSWETQLGAVVKTTWQEDELKKIELKPVKIDKNYQPRFMDFEEGKEVLGRLQYPNYEIIK
ncbi:MAG: CapA family protein [Patescibacteria group bacterium]